MAFPKLFIPRKNYLVGADGKELPVHAAEDELANYLAIERWANSLVAPLSSPGLVCVAYVTIDSSGLGAFSLFDERFVPVLAAGLGTTMGGTVPQLAGYIAATNWEANFNSVPFTSGAVHITGAFEVWNPNATSTCTAQVSGTGVAAGGAIILTVTSSTVVGTDLSVVGNTIVTAAGGTYAYSLFLQLDTSTVVP